MDLNFSKKEQKEILEIALTWIVVMAMFIYGGAKFMQFKGASQLDILVSEMTGMQLMWAFYGYSRPFQLILGFLEIAGGFLILVKRTRLIGGFVLSTILVNIILQDIFYGVHRGALMAAIIYQICILLIFWLNKTQVIDSLKILLQKKSNWKDKKRWLLKLTFAFLLFVVFRIAEYYITIVGLF